MIKLNKLKYMQQINKKIYDYDIMNIQTGKEK